MWRSPSSWSVLVLLTSASAVAACGHIDTSSVCIADCGPPTLQKSLVAVGFPQGRVDRTAVGPSGYYRGRLLVGESVTLFVISTNLPGFSADTIRRVVWGLSDSVAVAIQGQSDGGGRLTGRAPGVVTRVQGNGTPLVILSCPGSPGYCDRLEAIVITPDGALNQSLERTGRPLHFARIAARMAALRALGR